MNIEDFGDCSLCTQNIVNCNCNSDDFHEEIERLENKCKFYEEFIVSLQNQSDSSEYMVATFEGDVSLYTKTKEILEEAEELDED